MGRLTMPSAIPADIAERESDVDEGYTEEEESWIWKRTWELITEYLADRTKFISLMEEIDHRLLVYPDLQRVALNFRKADKHTAIAVNASLFSLLTTITGKAWELWASDCRAQAEDELRGGEDMSEETMCPKLLPCPFCGGKPWIEEIPAHTHHIAKFMPDHSGSFVIECTCGIGLIDEQREKVITAWNRRAPLTPRGEKGKGSNGLEEPSQEDIDHRDDDLYQDGLL